MHYTRIATKTLIVVFTAAVSAAQSAPQQPDALDLLKNVEATYAAVNTYSAKTINSTAMSGTDTAGKINMETSATVTIDSSGKFRMENKGMMSMLMVYDGSTMWLYIPSANSYSRIPLEGASSVHAGAMGGGMFGAANALQEYKNITAALKEAKVLRSEKLHVNDSDVDCWVVSLDYEGLGSEAIAAAEASSLPVSDFARSKMLWVDKSRYLVYQEDSTTKMTMPNTDTPTNVRQTSKVESITVNEPVSPDVFSFTPPPGAKEMSESSFKPKTPSTN